MKFKSIASPAPSKGADFSKEKSQVVPDQSLTLKEILERFTRNEALPISHPVEYHESDDDLEKVQHMDLVDREEYINTLKRTQRNFEAQEQKKAKQKAEKIEAEERKKIAEKLKKEAPEPPKAD